MAKKKKAKKAAAKKKAVAKKKAPAQRRPTEVAVRVYAQSSPMVPAVIPTSTDLAEPLTSTGGKLSIAKTWVSSAQILRMTEKTPAKYVYQRPGKGGGKWDYVSVSYVQRVLDFVFGFNWDFEVVQHGKEQDHVWVLGRLTVHSPDGTKSIVKTQFGRSEVKHKSGTKENLDYGNDLKAATSDALKKCASMLGIARDIYGKTDYKAESGITPRPEPVVDARTGEERVQDAVKDLKEKHSAPPPPTTEEVVCRGPKGKGCAYGNDVDPLSSQVANYSKKVYGRAMCRECQKDATPLKK